MKIAAIACAVLAAPVFIFAWAACKASADADRRMDEIMRREEGGPAAVQGGPDTDSGNEDMGGSHEA